MKKAAIISVGNELINGSCYDSNSEWLKEKLIDLNFELSLSMKLPDEHWALAEALDYASRFSDICIITGGLGPTKDDITRDALSVWTGRPLVYKDSLFAHIESYFQKRRRRMSEINSVQAYIPEGSQPLLNNNGTAPGIKISSGSFAVYSLPGVPSEMKAMFEQHIAPEISGQAFADRRVLKVFGLGESSVAELLGDMMDRGANPEINCTVKEYVITLSFLARAGSKEAEDLLSNSVDKAKSLLGEYVYADEDISLPEAAVRRLLDAGKTVTTAESCTGGLIAKLLTDVPGSSGCFQIGWVSYSNEAKSERLGVCPDTLKQYGAVSEQTVREMAENALKISAADFSVSVSGVAGPSGGTEQKPVGTVYICVASKEKCVVRKLFYPGGRKGCRLRAALTGIDVLRREFL
ncbi:Nicotinamide-nucleotide amidohydrolase PncC [Sedimentisphaera cyanobacteriorum]|uniref:CinA-like protein n=1 Tax=Sedimentisphaera cyanobacteriorum TaxID=1940790 RepID=A0A1Q2HQD5_9BACT|nr:competence/damage-inducible protein A [Sedimentisphaera cyanobacteriorum]AQQ09453.1 Nicotinamide-nucleotide amidohydrolase PncC [Sedimentisphaera cyanobacteriorum]